MREAPHFPLATVPGFYPELDADAYFRDPCPTPSLNNSLIDLLVEASPEHAAARHPRLNPYGDALESTKAQWLGSAVHRLALGRGREVAVLKYPDFKSSTARRARDLAIDNGRIPVLEREFQRAESMAKRVRARIEEELEGAPFETEVPLVWIEETPAGPIWCRAMLDVWCESLATEIDVKTTRGFATADFAGRDMAANGYDTQRRFYARGLAAVRPDLAGRIKSKTLYVENALPFGARAFQLTEASNHVADMAIDSAVRLWGECVAARSWPGYPRGSVLVNTPTFHHNKWIERELAGELS